MKSAIVRILSSLCLLLIFGLALYLRLYGADWGLKDRITNFHPDERHYTNCAMGLRPQGLTEEERNLPWREQLQILYERNLEVKEGVPSSTGKPGLRPINYNYGTFPNHLYLLYQEYLSSHKGLDNSWNFLSVDWLGILAGFFVFVIGIRLFIAVNRDFKRAKETHGPLVLDERRLPFLFPSLIIPITGLLLVVFMPSLIIDFAASNYQPDMSSIVLIGRIVTAWMGALTVLLVYLIGRDAYNRTAGLIAAAMLAVAMLHVQTCHFMTVDGVLGFWVTAAIYCFLKISQKPRLIWYILGAICTGFSVGSKWSGLTLPGIYLLAHAVGTWGDNKHGKVGRWINTVWVGIAGLILLHFFKAASSTEPPFNVTLAQFCGFYGNHWILWIVFAAFLFIASMVMLYIRHIWNDRETGWFCPAFRLYLPWVWFVLGIPIGVAAFLFAEPMAYFDSVAFARNIIEQSGINMTGTYPVPYTLQFSNTVPFFTSLDNLFYPSLDHMTAFFAVVGCLYAIYRIFWTRSGADVVLASWAIPSFILYSTFSSKFPRYMIPVLPILLVLGARLIADLIHIKPQFYSPEFPKLTSGWKTALKRFGIVGGTAALLFGFIYGWAYSGIYSRPHPAITMGKYIRENTPRGAKIAKNNWDESAHGVSIRQEFDVHANVHSEKNINQRIQYLANVLANNDYILFPSKRPYGSTLHNPEKFPITNQFLQALFAEQLGFRIAKIVTNPPQFLGWEFRVDEEDETARIYDHPKMILFEKVHDFSKDELKELILNPPTWVTRITEKDILTARDGYPVYAPYPEHPVLNWWIVLQLLGGIAFIFLFPFCSKLPGRGFEISKAVGLALFAWIGWVLASIGTLPLSRGGLFFIFLVLLGAAVWSAYRRRIEILAFIRQKWPLLVGMEVLFLVLWSFFLIVRAYHPDAHQGEKPMNASFVSAMSRAETCPPEDPWISGYPVNYYYYGHALFTIVGRFAGLPPEYIFNIGGTCATALAGLGIFALTYALCRKTVLSLLALYLGLFSAHLFTFFDLTKWDPSARPAPGFSVSSCIQGIQTVSKLIWMSICTYLGLASQATLDKIFHTDYGAMFWNARSHIFPGTVANEFPYWTHLFFDMHAHMLVIPFTFAFLILLYAYFARPLKEKGAWAPGTALFFLALLLGTVICTNTWDLPGLLIAFLLVAAIKFYRESDLATARFTKLQWISPEGIQSFFRFPLGPILAVFGLGVLLYYPFHHNFISRVNSIGWMSEGSSTVSSYLGFFGHLLLPVAVGVTFLAFTHQDGSFSKKRVIGFTGFYLLTFAVAKFVTWYINAKLETDSQYFHGWFTKPSLPTTSGGLGEPLDYTVVGMFLPFLFVLFLLLWNRKRDSASVFTLLIGLLGLGLSMGIEFFHINEGWSIPNHRYNTVFKFNIQVWQYLAIFAALSLPLIWNGFHALCAQLRNRDRPVLRHIHPGGFDSRPSDPVSVDASLHDRFPGYHHKNGPRVDLSRRDGRCPLPRRVFLAAEKRISSVCGNPMVQSICERLPQYC